MNDPALHPLTEAPAASWAEPATTLVSVNTEHGPLHGYLTLHPKAAGLVVLAHDTRKLDARDNHLAGILRHAGLSTLTVDLVTPHEENYPDIHYHVALLARRLADFIALIRHRMIMEELPTQAIGLCGTHTTTPVVIRLASLRSHDIAAIVCRGGLIDLAGVLYLRVLESPLLLLMEETDETHAASNRRALQEVNCPKALTIVPEIGPDYAISPAFAQAASETAQWFQNYFAPNSTAATSV